MLAIITTHPIQYQVPLWQALACDGTVPFEVWYLSSHGVDRSLDPGFGQTFAWDLDMLSGYPHRFLEVASDASPNSFWKCRTRESLVERMRGAGVKGVWVQGWQVAGYWQAVWAAKKIGAEVWLRGESNDLAPTPFWKRLLKQIVLGQLFKRVDRFLYIGTANRRLYQKFGVQDDQLYPAPYAVDNERFASQAEALQARRSAIRAQWGIPEDAFCVLFCGKFLPKKRPMDLIKAAQFLITDRPAVNIHLLFVGSGELGADLRANCNVVFDQDVPKQAADLRSLTYGVKPPASFAGFLNQTEISKAYVAADRLVLPSDSGETWGLVVNEAIASGLPCIISNLCGCSEDLAALSGNQEYRCGDVDALRKALFHASLDRRRQRDHLGLPSLTETVATAKLVYTTPPAVVASPA